MRQEAGVGVGVDRCHLLAQRRQRTVAQLAQHLGVAELEAGAAGTELAAHDALARFEFVEHGVDEFARHPEARRRFVAHERAVGARPPAHQLQQPVGRVGEKRLGHADRQRGGEGVAIAAGVFDGDQAFITGDAHPQGAAVADEFLRQLVGVGRLDAAQSQLGHRQVADAAQKVVRLVDRADLAVLAQSLQVVLQRLEGVGVEQFTQFLGADQFGQQAPVEGERLRPAFGERRVAVVEKRRHVRVGQAAGERRRQRRVDRGHADLALLDVAQDLLERRNVEGVAQALAVGLEQDRERAVVGGDSQQVGAALAHLPQRRALTGTPPRQQQRARCVLAEAGGEHAAAS